MGNPAPTVDEGRVIVICTYGHSSFAGFTRACQRVIKGVSPVTNSVQYREHCEPGFFSMEKVTSLASEKGVVLFSKSSCCMCYAVKILFQELRVTPMVHEIDQDPEGWEMEKALKRLGCNGPVPAIFIGGKLVGSTNEVMSLHLSGGLLPMLKPYQTLC
ncbi:hypothetical protein Goshw_016505 [Gossypium schwendimanii]|uniref:Glutaredoxin domain-containing protein n=1 Tax=Gossypium schwendimanii TaxID=34291 RepID=A0A7J9LWE5_GOSSC|nr:hypothetical protein [Gossypium schwendimanii]